MTTTTVRAMMSTGSVVTTGAGARARGARARRLVHRGYPSNGRRATTRTGALKDGERMGRIVTVVPGEMGAKTPRELARGDRLYTYKRDGKTCRRCDDEIRSADADGRNVWWCPTCQPVNGELVQR